MKQQHFTLSSAHFHCFSLTPK